MRGLELVADLGRRAHRAAYFVQNESFRAFEVYLFVTAAYMALALAYRAAFWAIAFAAFPRRRAALVAGLRASLR